MQAPAGRHAPAGRVEQAPAEALAVPMRFDVQLRHIGPIRQHHHEGEQLAATLGDVDLGRAHELGLYPCQPVPDGLDVRGAVALCRAPGPAPDAGECDLLRPVAAPRMQLQAVGVGERHVIHKQKMPAAPGR